MSGAGATGRSRRSRENRGGDKSPSRRGGGGGDGGGGWLSVGDRHPKNRQDEKTE